jgi:hypothetical protein
MRVGCIYEAKWCSPQSFHSVSKRRAVDEGNLMLHYWVGTISPSGGSNPIPVRRHTRPDGQRVQYDELSNPFQPVCKIYLLGRGGKLILDRLLLSPTGCRSDHGVPKGTPSISTRRMPFGGRVLSYQLPFQSVCWIYLVRRGGNPSLDCRRPSPTVC